MTSTTIGQPWTERWNPRNWPLAWKLVAIAAVPAILALVLGALRVTDQAATAAELGDSTALVKVHGEVAGAADALRQERNDATVFVAGARAGDRNALDGGFGRTDAALAQAVTAVRNAEGTDEASRVALQQLEGGIAGLGTLRADATANPAVPADAVRNRYTDLVTRVDGLDRAIVRQIRAPGAAGPADAVTATTGVREQLALQHTTLAAAIRANKVTPADAALVGITDIGIGADHDEYIAALTPDQVHTFGDWAANPANANRERVKSAILATPPDAPVTVPANVWDNAYAGALSDVANSGDLARDDINAVSIAAEEKASNLAGINSVILMLGLLLGATIAVLVARSLIRSLRMLRTAALDVAQRRLPQVVESMRAGETTDVGVDPVPLTTRDEVGQVARAFDAVHGQAVRLAADQAALQTNVSAMFVNLSRRSQALVERQLQLIEQLESNEQDSDQLSNLFQLDHLATRMRRNSENLLVLAGTDLAKRNSAPVPLVDVLRAAVSEIEQYQRVVVQSPPPAGVAGRAASDVVHLIAELLDNATNFSPPDSQVVMSTTRASDGSIVVEIADRGVGMVDHELHDANQRLAGPTGVDVNASRRMGLFVVGRLSARHGIEVQLNSAPGGAGLTAVITVPAALIASNEPGQNTSRPAPRPSVDRSVPTQRATNGLGSLSALVAGADGPSTPAGPSGLDPASTGAALFGGPPPANGSGSNPLPTRRPGSTIRPIEPLSGDVASRAAADQAAARERDARRNDSAERNGAGVDVNSLFDAGTEPDDDTASASGTPGRSGLGAAGLAAGAMAGAAALFGRNKAAKRDDRADKAPEQDANQAQQPAADNRPVDNRAADTEQRPAPTGRPDQPAPGGAAAGAASGSAPAASTGPKPLPRRIPNNNQDPNRPTLAAQYGMGRFAPGQPAPGQSAPGQSRPGQSGPGQSAPGQSAPTDGRSAARPDNAPPRPSPRPGPGPIAGQQPSNAPSSDQPAPRQFLAGLFGTGKPTSDSSSTDGSKTGPSAAAAAVAAGGAAIAGVAAAAEGRQADTAGGAEKQQAGTESKAPDADQADPAGSATAADDTAASDDTAADQTAAKPTTEAASKAAEPVAKDIAENKDQAAKLEVTKDQVTKDEAEAQATPDKPTEQAEANTTKQADPAAPGAASIPVIARQPALPTQALPPRQGPSDQLPRRTPGRANVVPKPLAAPPAGGRDQHNGAPVAQNPATTPQQADNAGAGELFVPSGTPSNGVVTGQHPPVTGSDGPAIGETTPIFEEIASAWFRSNRPLPVTWDTEDGSEQPAAPAGGAAPQAPQAPRPAPGNRPGTGPLPASAARPWQPRRPADEVSVPRPNPAPQSEQTGDRPQPVGSAPAAEVDFASAADEGWRAAQGVTAERSDELTSAGLPKRRPRARLVPGSAGSAVLAAPVAATRSAENIRGRLSSYQQGVRQGRENRGQGGLAEPGTSPAGSGGNHDEESS